MLTCFVKTIPEEIKGAHVAQCEESRSATVKGNAVEHSPGRRYLLEYVSDCQWNVADSFKTPELRLHGSGSERSVKKNK